MGSRFFGKGLAGAGKALGEVAQSRIDNISAEMRAKNLARFQEQIDIAKEDREHARQKDRFVTKIRPDGSITSIDTHSGQESLVQGRAPATKATEWESYVDDNGVRWHFDKNNPKRKIPAGDIVEQTKPAAAEGSFRAAQEEGLLTKGMRTEKNFVPIPFSNEASGSGANSAKVQYANFVAKSMWPELFQSDPEAARAKALEWTRKKDPMEMVGDIYKALVPQLGAEGALAETMNVYASFRRFGGEGGLLSQDVPGLSALPDPRKWAQNTTITVGDKQFRVVNGRLTIARDNPAAARPPSNVDAFGGAGG